MKPLSALPNVESIEGVVFDVDDTVTADGRLQPVALTAMDRARRAGLRLIAITGRPLGWVDVIARQWPVELAVGENGAGWVCARDGAVTEGYFANDTERAAHGEALRKIRDAVDSAMPDINVAADQRARRCDLAFDIGEHDTVPATRIAELVHLIESNGVRSSVSSVHAHAIPGDWNKANGLVHAAQQALGIDVGANVQRWAFIGDSGNDAAAFEYFPVSIGVSNVRAHLSRIASPPKFVTDNARGDGFAELVDHLLAAR